MFSDTVYFSYLYEIASTLNKEFSLHSALRKALEKTVELLELETGWIWLMQGDKSVYLAASYNLPPALRDHPERLAGRCYCIEKYLSNNIDQARNVSEIACSRLKNIRLGTDDLRFHATIPINIGNQKAGLINLLTKHSSELNEMQLSVLNTISELIGMAIQRTQALDTHHVSSPKSTMNEVLRRSFIPRLDAVVSQLKKAKSAGEGTEPTDALQLIDQSLEDLEQLGRQLSHILTESQYQAEQARSEQFHYPATGLTKRELELLAMVKKGYTNKQVADALFISERTVKFHITSILSKLFARTRTEAVDIALKRGLISL
jgi:two-component system, NarL family, sensor kinase